MDVAGLEVTGPEAFSRTRAEGELTWTSGARCTLAAALTEDSATGDAALLCTSTAGGVTGLRAAIGGCGGALAGTTGVAVARR
ncbi:hypothetical protein KGQ20_46645 [Catenulispora sp. NF23]|uniref:Uncharacterized protein n=1 Tax=Catenulispora pinistramenti TaxID=2705254 RepID=A0ABS5L8G0_9ACTN|nr:hypothetical protein [Catenulispora pinistramenti]MBS2540241.1 hypothetical protein [Catenulispora pinistramenti]MBS2554651.1 hypothetical protein [Catenulispora pinistramenti]